MKRVVFGMGITLINNWDLIQKEFNPDFAVDNNPDKWMTRDEYTGLVCYSFDDIKQIKNVDVLITVGDPYAIDAIKKQLDSISIHYCVLMEMMELWCRKLHLPTKIENMGKNVRKIILFNTPEHDNIGDHLIALSELNLIGELFPKIPMYEITDIEYMRYHERIKKMIASDDLIIISGGGYMGSLWLYNCETNVRRIIKEYPNNRIIIFPQTVYFEGNSRGEREYQLSKEIYREHQGLTICAREKKSYDLFVEILNSNDNVILLPDIAFFYDEKMPIQKNRSNKCKVCFRRDKEAILSENERICIIRELEKNGYMVEETSMHEGVFDIQYRKDYVTNKLKELSEASLIVTDTLHCMISAALVGSECLFFDNLSGKVKNVYEWIRTNRYIHYCDDIEAFQFILKDLEIRDNIFILENKEKYKQLIEEMIMEGFS